MWAGWGLGFLITWQEAGDGVAAMARDREC